MLKTELEARVKELEDALEKEWEIEAELSRRIDNYFHGGGANLPQNFLDAWFEQMTGAIRDRKQKVGLR